MTEPVTVCAGASSSEAPPAAGPVPGRWVLFPLLLATNGAAAWGQSYWLHDNVTDPAWVTSIRWGISVGVALVLELLGVYLATMADQAEERRIPSAGIRTMSYLVGLAVGCQNFAHWLAHGSLFAAIVFGFLSSISPFAWSIYARVRRARRVAPSRWLWHPIRSIALVRYAAWEGIADEDQARIQFEVFRKGTDGDEPVSGAGGRSKRELGMEAFRLRSENPGWSWERVASELGITPRYLLDCRKEAEVR